MNKEYNNSNIEIKSNLHNISFIEILFKTKISIIPLNTKVAIIPFNYTKDDLVDVPLIPVNNKIKYHYIYCNWFC
jgi:hypothetical protein